MVLPPNRIQIRCKRVYEPAAESDGTRVLVDRLWPRGLSRKEAAVDRWLRELSPSTELRRWYGHDPALWEEFRRRYALELSQQKEAFDGLLHLCREGPVSLLYGSRERERNNAEALKEVILERAQREG